MRDRRQAIDTATRTASSGSLVALVLALALPSAALLCCWLLPPLVAFEPERGVAFALAAVGAALMLLPSWPAGLRLIRSAAERVAPRVVSLKRRHDSGLWRVALGSGMRATGAAILWSVLGWCVFSQAAPLATSRSEIWAQRALPVAFGLGVWLALQLPRGWQRRGLLGVALPSVVALGALAWPAPPRVVDFAPYYLAVDSHGTLYASDAYAAVIRVFAPDGSLVAKLRPGLASRAGPPGSGFSPPGPYNDPDRLGVARATPGATGIPAQIQPWPVGADDFWFCGMSVGPGDRIFVPDWMRGRLLRFAPDGRLEASWPLPTGYQPSLGCVATVGSVVYLADTRGTLLKLDASTGEVIQTWSVGEPILGGISATPDGGAVFVLARSRVYRLDPRPKAQPSAPTSWALPMATGPLRQPYQAILALRDGRVLLANLAAHRVDVYSAAGTPMGSIGRRGPMPGEFGQVGGLAGDTSGRIYVADGDSRAVQRFTPSGQINALYWGPDDDEID